MKIAIIGSGCPTCKRLHEETLKVVQELGIQAEVEYSTDVSKIIELGLMQSPVLVVDGKAVMVGAGKPDKIKESLQKALV